MLPSIVEFSKLITTSKKVLRLRDQLVKKSRSHSIVELLKRVVCYYWRDRTILFVILYKYRHLDQENIPVSAARFVTVPNTREYNSQFTQPQRQT